VPTRYSSAIRHSVTDCSSRHKDKKRVLIDAVSGASPTCDVAFVPDASSRATVIFASCQRAPA
jgi:hypothetical protein